MKYRITFFILFLSVVMWLLVGIYKYPLLTQFLYFVLFFVIVLFSYRLYLLVEKLGVFLYERFFKDIITEIKKAKQEIEKE